MIYVATLRNKQLKKERSKKSKLKQRGSKNTWSVVGIKWCAYGKIIMNLRTEKIMKKRRITPKSDLPKDQCSRQNLKMSSFLQVSILVIQPGTNLYSAMKELCRYN